MLLMRWQKAVARAACRLTSVRSGVESMKRAMTVTRSTAWKRTRQSECRKTSCKIFQNMSLPTGSVMQWSSSGTHTWEICENSELHNSHKLKKFSINYWIFIKEIKLTFESRDFPGTRWKIHDDLSLLCGMRHHEAPKCSSTAWFGTKSPASRCLAARSAADG